MKRNSATADPAFDTWLGAQLQAAEPYLEDDGFTERVISSLPSSAELNPYLRYTILSLMLAAPLAIVAWQFPLLGVLLDAQVSLSLSQPHTLWLAAISFAVGAASAGIWSLSRDPL